MKKLLLIVAVLGLSACKPEEPKSTFVPEKIELICSGTSKDFWEDGKKFTYATTDSFVIRTVGIMINGKLVEHFSINKNGKIEYGTWQGYNYPSEKQKPRLVIASKFNDQAVFYESHYFEDDDEKGRSSKNSQVFSFNRLTGEYHEGWIQTTKTEKGQSLYQNFRTEGFCKKATNKF